MNVRKFAIVGHPLKHTMSPPIHQKLFQLSGREQEEYLIMDIPPAELGARMKELAALDGFNVTIPHKVSIIPYLDELDKSARTFGAVNCVTKEDGRLIGYNTDCYGFARGLQAAGANMEGKKVLLLGCGGVGRMMAIETAVQGALLTIAVREGFEYETVPVLEEIKRAARGNASVTVTNLDKIHENFDLCVNSTPVGMFPHIDECPITDDVIAKCSVIFDAIYNPIQTTLMKKAKAFGRQAVGGMGMLVWQAVIAHEIWDKAKYDDQAIAQLIKDMEAIVMRDFQ